MPTVLAQNYYRAGPVTHYQTMSKGLANTGLVLNGISTQWNPRVVHPGGTIAGGQMTMTIPSDGWYDVIDGAGATGSAPTPSVPSNTYCSAIISGVDWRSTCPAYDGTW